MTGIIGVQGLGRESGLAIPVESAAGGLVLQVVQMDIAQATGTTAIPHDGTVPVVTEGTQIGTQTITLASTDSRVQVIGCPNGGDKTSVAQDAMVVAVFRGSTCIGAQVFDGNTPGGTSGKSGSIGFNLIDSPSSTSELTYSVRIGIISSYTWFAAQSRYQNSEGDLGGALEDGVTLMELAS